MILFRNREKLVILVSIENGTIDEVIDALKVGGLDNSLMLLMKYGTRESPEQVDEGGEVIWGAEAWINFLIDCRRLLGLRFCFWGDWLWGARVMSEMRGGESGRMKGAGAMRWRLWECLGWCGHDAKGVAVFGFGFPDHKELGSFIYRRHNIVHRYALSNLERMTVCNASFNDVSSLIEAIVRFVEEMKSFCGVSLGEKESLVF